MSIRRIIAFDCETDPAKHGRVPVPFLWGAYDGEAYRQWGSTAKFAAWLACQDALAFAHNGGRFDFHFLTRWWTPGKLAIINGRLVCVTIGLAECRDSLAIAPVALDKTGGKLRIDYGKLSRRRRRKHMPEIERYLEADCRALYVLVAATRERVGKRLTLAGNALSMAKGIGIDPGGTNEAHDAHFRRWYVGGRCEAFAPGRHRGVKLYDIRSAYPRAMLDDHPSGDLRTTLLGPAGLKLPDDQLQRAFLEFDADSQGAFPLREDDGRLTFPHKRARYAVTGWEYIVARDRGLVHGLDKVRVVTLGDTINFAPYVDHWFAAKAEAEASGDTVARIIAKLMLNSLYGKLAQNPREYKEYRALPPGTPFPGVEWSLAGEPFAHVEIHQRPRQAAPERAEYINVATAASITGWVRARLLDAICDVRERGGRVLYCDTDSLFVTGGKLATGDKLGDWKLEHEGADLWLAAKKLYVARIGRRQVKLATKGCKLTGSDVIAITRGEARTWRAPFPTFAVFDKPSFVVRKIAREK